MHSSNCAGLLHFEAWASKWKSIQLIALDCYILKHRVKNWSNSTSARVTFKCKI
jgi:hypothetical protein